MVSALLLMGGSSLEIRLIHLHFSFTHPSMPYLTQSTDVLIPSCFVLCKSFRLFYGSDLRASEFLPTSESSLISTTVHRCSVFTGYCHYLLQVQVKKKQPHTHSHYCQIGEGILPLMPGLPVSSPF